MSNRPPFITGILVVIINEGQPSVSYATWLDDGKSWAALAFEDLQFNLDVREYFRARGK